MSIQRITNAVFGPPPQSVKPSQSLEERVAEQEKELKALKEQVKELQAAIKLLLR